MKNTISILNIMLNFAASLSDSQLIDLVEKRATLKLAYEKDRSLKKEISSNTTRDFEKIYSELESFVDTNSAITYLTSIELTKADLEKIAKKYSVPLLSKDKNETRVKRIVENVIGSKLTFDSLLSLNLKK